MTEDLTATCYEIEEEIGRVLTQKFSWDPERARLALEAVLARSLHVTLKGAVQKSRDPHDDKFLERALLAQADLLIAGDRDLLDLESFRGTSIITPAQYVSGDWSQSD